MTSIPTLDTTVIILDTTSAGRGGPTSPGRGQHCHCQGPQPSHFVSRHWAQGLALSFAAT